MYLNALESQRIPDTNTLSLIYLWNQARSTVQSPAIEVTEQNQSPVEVTKSPSAHLRQTIQDNRPLDLIKKLDYITSKIQLQLVLLFFIIRYFYIGTVVF